MASAYSAVFLCCISIREIRRAETFVGDILHFCPYFSVVHTRKFIRLEAIAGRLEAIAMRIQALCLWHLMAWRVLLFEA